MRIFQIIFIQLLGLTITSVAENVLIINSAFARPGDTITVSASITNTDRFISFQFDLPLPENVGFLPNSIHMSERGAYHTVIGNVVEPNVLRVFSYSSNNKAFQGNSGDVVSFQLVVGNIRGEFPLVLADCIIGDSLSANILTGTGNGILSVFPLGLNDQGGKSVDKAELSIFPNPVDDHATISFTVADLSKVVLTLINQDGKKERTTEIENVGKGWHSVKMPDEMIEQMESGKIYCLKISMKSTNGKIKNEAVKMIRIEK